MKKLLAAVLVLVCFVLGAVGLILPIIPGLLFMAVAVLILARHFPSTKRRLSRSRAVGRHLDRADRFLDLTLRGKLRLSGLICVRILLDGIAFIGSLATKRLNPAGKKGI